MKKLLLVPIMIITISSCVKYRADPERTENLVINHHKRYAVFDGRDMMLMYKYSRWPDSIRWSRLPGGIQDFEYHWGYRYELKVITNHDMNGEFGNSIPFYRLQEIISKTEADKNDTFEILLKVPKWGKAVSGNEISGFRLLDSTKVDCADQYDELVDWLENKDTIVGVFSHKNFNTILLQNLKSGDREWFINNLKVGNESWVP